MFDEVRIDVQLGKRPHIAPETLEGPDYLAFIGARPIMVPALPLTIQIAEKLHALTRTYGSGAQSTRVKDLTDLVLISSRLRKTFSTVRTGRKHQADIRGTRNSRSAHSFAIAAS